MRGPRVPVVAGVEVRMMHSCCAAAIAALMLVSCGGSDSSLGDTSPAPVPTMSTPPDVPSTSVNDSRPPTTVADAAIPESTTAPAEQLTILRPDGLGPVDFGTPADETIAALTDILGPFDRDETVDPVSIECVEGSGWRDCLAVVESASILTWTKWGLNVLVTDHGGWDGAMPRSVPSHFGSWQATPLSTGDTLVSTDGLRPGMTIGDLRVIRPDVEFGYGEGIISGVYIETPNGGYWGELDWDSASAVNTWSELVRAVQVALNASGAELAVDGEWGPRSQRAWEAFFEENNLGPAPGTMWLTPDVGDALGVPPDNFTVAYLAASCIEAGTDQVC